MKCSVADMGPGGSGGMDTMGRLAVVLKRVKMSLEKVRIFFT
jgi:hypothetical protein